MTTTPEQTTTLRVGSPFWMHGYADVLLDGTPVTVTRQGTQVPTGDAPGLIERAKSVHVNLVERVRSTPQQPPTAPPEAPSVAPVVATNEKVSDQ